MTMTELLVIAFYVAAVVFIVRFIQVCTRDDRDD